MAMPVAGLPGFQVGGGVERSLPLARCRTGDVVLPDRDRGAVPGRLILKQFQ